MLSVTSSATGVDCAKESAVSAATPTASVARVRVSQTGGPSAS